ncbi:MAG: TerC family protein, partial [Propionibacteriales bacterium]|nr:TerC family protein [Propionibacteriales bacterium]
FIALGAAVIERFAAVFFLFGAFLIYTAVKLVIDWYADKDEDEGDNALVRWVKKRFPSTDDFHGIHMFAKVDGKKLATPMLFVIIGLGTTDLMFALDSIPAIFGLTKEPFLVLTANVFALMGLRQLYFLIGGLLDRLVYLSVGLSVILAFIGVKLLLTALHDTKALELVGYTGPIPEIPLWMSLGVIVVTLLVTTVASLIKTRNDPPKADKDEESASDVAANKGDAR